MTHPELVAELERRAGQDQQVRRVADKTQQDIDRWMAVDADNQRWMWGVLREHGWPGHALVGEEGAAHAALIVQHADRDRALQLFGLGLLIEAVDADDADPSHAAYLIDRIHMHRGVPTRYGTQYARNRQGELELLAVEDPEALDARRAGMGLPPLDEFERQLRELHPALGDVKEELQL
ncbi:hypothetical protein JQK87_03655 [Streptomyces sp. G44]|uniref:DUF6624 domain-containing protein n=1 Tax=Streptomyces sp. G44 TaxID=2807632 RepID=UPI001961D4FA|nr:DUF6624 domain-containing protein [Streptomyces sp. G44]MBM7167521.1 hypothetical protein [Streptomyces sp. G44]